MRCFRKNRVGPQPIEGAPAHTERLLQENFYPLYSTHVLKYAIGSIIALAAGIYSIRVFDNVRRATSSNVVIVIIYITYIGGWIIAAATLVRKFRNCLSQPVATKNKWAKHALDQPNVEYTPVVTVAEATKTRSCVCCRGYRTSRCICWPCCAPDCLAIDVPYLLDIENPTLIKDRESMYKQKKLIPPGDMDDYVRKCATVDEMYRFAINNSLDLWKTASVWVAHQYLNQRHYDEFNDIAVLLGVNGRRWLDYKILMCLASEQDENAMRLCDVVARRLLKNTTQLDLAYERDKKAEMPEDTWLRILIACLTQLRSGTQLLLPIELARCNSKYRVEFTDLTAETCMVVTEHFRNRTARTHLEGEGSGGGGVL